MSKIRKSVGAAIFERRRILLVIEGGVYKLPGGGKEGRETDQRTLRREIGEELSGEKLQKIRLYKRFTGETPSGYDIEASIYFAERVKKGVVKISSEIEDYVWLSYSGVRSNRLKGLTQMILESLHKDGHF